MKRTVEDEFDDELIRQIFRTIKTFSRTLNNEVFTHGLHSSEWMVLNFIYIHNGMSQAELVEYFAIEPAAITRTLIRLEKKDIIWREPVPIGRGKFIYLTEKGMDICKRLEPSVIQHRRNALKKISIDERQKLMKLMEIIYISLEKNKKV